MRRLLRALDLLLAGALLVHAGHACSQTGAKAPPPRFEIVRFAIEGNTLLKAEDAERAVAPYVGARKDFDDIQRALEALEQSYRDRGYGLVHVLLTEQDITRGVVQLRVIEPRLGKVSVEGNRYFDVANVRASLPGLRPGETPNSQQVARNVQLLSGHPAKQTTVLLQPGATRAELDAVARVSDEPPLRFTATLDNSGTRESGRARAGIGVQHANLFNRDHVLDIQYLASVEHPGNAAIYGAGYRIPFYAQASSLDLIVGYSDVAFGALPGLFCVSGSGTLFGAHYTLHLARLGEYAQKLTAGLDYRAYRNQVVANAGLVPAVIVHPASVGYEGLWRSTGTEIGVYANYLQNVVGGGSAGSDADFKAARADATANYRVWRVGAHYAHVFVQDWQLRATLNGQYSADALVPGEQFGFGGPDSVRGFNIREVVNDRGYAASVEIQTPELAPRFRWTDARARLLAFYDAGTTSRNSARPGDAAGQSGGSLGVGLRFAYGKRLRLRLDFARVVDPAGQQARGDQMLHAAIAARF